MPWLGPWNKYRGSELSAEGLALEIGLEGVASCSAGGGALWKELLDEGAWNELLAEGLLLILSLEGVVSCDAGCASQDILDKCPGVETLAESITLELRLKRVASCDVGCASQELLDEHVGLVSEDRMDGSCEFVASDKEIELSDEPPFNGTCGRPRPSSFPGY